MWSGGPSWEPRKGIAGIGISRLGLTMNEGHPLGSPMHFTQINKSFVNLGKLNNQYLHKILNTYQMSQAL